MPKWFWVWRSIGSIASAYGTSSFRAFPCGENWSDYIADAAGHAVDAPDRGHTGPAKNGGAFERLGTMTTLADRKGTVKGCDILS